MERDEAHVTCIGYVNSIKDAELLLDACLQGYLPQVSRRLRAKEHTALVKSGNIFIYDERASNIKRWTDGRSWSPRRSLGEFYVYHELESKKGSMPKDAGLVRKTVSLTRHDASYRLVSYFTEEDVQTGVLATPSSYIQPESPDAYQDIFGIQLSDDYWDQLLHVSYDGDLGWETYQPWLQQDMDFELGHESKDENSNDCTLFKALGLSQEV